MLCYTYKSLKKDGIYLYVADKNKINELPEELTQLLGRLQYMLVFKLTSDRKIEKVKADDVIKAIEEKGYFLRIDTELESNNLLNQERARLGLSPISNEKISLK